MSVRMFDQHTFDVKVKVTVDMICKREGYYENPAEISAMKNEKCHLDFVVAVWDKISEKAEELQAKKDYYFSEIQKIGASARVPKDTFAKYLDGLKNDRYVDFTFDMSAEKSKQFRETVDNFSEIKRKLVNMIKYQQQIEDIITSKPIMPYPQEQRAMESLPKKLRG